jgi:membrane protease YdiL (CAAX protease family)
MYFFFFLFLYFPSILLCLLCLLKDRYKIEDIPPEAQSFSLLYAVVFVTIYQSYEILYTAWYQKPIFGYGFSYAREELCVFIFVFMILILILFISKKTKLPLKLILNIQKCHVYNMLKMGSIFIGIVVLISLLPGDETTHGLKDNDLTLLESLPLPILFITVITTIGLSPIVEEIVCRGLLYSQLYRKIGRPAAIILTSCIFFYMHSSALFNCGVSYNIGIFIKGLFLTWIYDKKKTLVHPIGFHMLFNVLALYSDFFES